MCACHTIISSKSWCLPPALALAVSVLYICTRLRGLARDQKRRRPRARDYHPLPSYYYFTSLSIIQISIANNSFYFFSFKEKIVVAKLPTTIIIVKALVIMGSKYTWKKKSSKYNERVVFSIHTLRALKSSLWSLCNYAHRNIQYIYNMRIHTHTVCPRGGTLSVANGQSHTAKS